MDNFNKIEKICGFAVSDWHLILMLLPYLKKQIENKNQIITFLEEDLEESIDLLINKLNFKEEMKNKIKSVNWNKSNQEMEEKLKSTHNNTTIIVSGNLNYIKFVNEKIENFFEKDSNINIKIVNLFKTSDIGVGVKDILDKHSKILNTAGERNIEEVI